MKEHRGKFAPVDTVFLTPGVKALVALIAMGMAFGIYRFVFGLASVT
ncbi:MAG: hypothetical protein GY866_13570, partial [Proteobacteria bacterium]|nr:hypothetical protein [Pseudomonadota bacterium]